MKKLSSMTLRQRMHLGLRTVTGSGHAATVEGSVETGSPQKSAVRMSRGKICGLSLLEPREMPALPS